MASDPLLVDDSNSIVQYQSGWEWQHGLLSQQVDNTQHAGPVANIIASLAFFGTGIEVVGVLEPQNGQPEAQFTVDNQLVGHYVGPDSPPGSTQFNVTYFSKFDLSLGDHTVVVKNMRASPNILLLDYFLVYQNSHVVQPPQPQSQTTATTRTSTTQPPTSTTTHSFTTTLPTKSTTSTNSTSSPTSTGHFTSTSTNPDSISASGDVSTTDNSSSNTLLSFATSTDSPLVSTLTMYTPVSSSTPSNVTAQLGNSPTNDARGPNIAAIVGGVAGAALFIMLAILVFIIRRRRRRTNYAYSDIPDSSSNVTPSPTTPAPMAQRQADYGSGRLAPNRFGFDASTTTLIRSPTASTSTNHGTSEKSSSYPMDPQYGMPLDAGWTAESSSQAGTSVPTGTDTRAPSSPPLPPPAASNIDDRGLSSPEAVDLRNVPIGPNVLYVPPGLQPTLLASLIQAVSGPSGANGAGADPREAVDSGVRMYDEGMLPPRYTEA